VGTGTSSITSGAPNFFTTAAFIVRAIGMILHVGTERYVGCTTRNPQTRLQLRHRLI
jgi:hypothetical protein